MTVILKDNGHVEVVETPNPQADHYRDAIARACEGWTLPPDLRKMLETALWNPPPPTIQTIA